VERAEGDRKVEAFSLSIRGLFAAMQGRFGEARELRDRGRRGYEELGLRLFVAGVTHYTGDIEKLAGDLAAAEAQHRESYERLSRMGAKTYLASTLFYLAEAVYEQGRYDEAYTLTEEAERLAGDERWRVVRARLLARRGEYERAEALARQAVSDSQGLDLIDERATTHCGLADVLRLAGRPDQAAMEVEAALRLYEQKGNEVMAERMRSLLSELAIEVR
jgi:tetratricopeptide (TPR) repeat protein